MNEPRGEDATKNRKLRLCGVSLYGYPLFHPDCVSPFGGSEVRIALIARELAKFDDLDVHLVVFDHGQPRREEREGVTLHPWPGRFCPIQADCRESGMPAQQSGPGRAGFESPPPSSLHYRQARLWIKAHVPQTAVRLLRKFRYQSAAVSSLFSRAGALLRGEELFGRIRSLVIRKDEVRIFEEIDADVYFTHGNHDLAAKLAFYCRQRGRKYMMLGASDHDFVAAHEARTRRTDMYGSLGYLLIYTIENADLICVQTRHQADLARRYFSREALVIPNPVELAPKFARSPASRKILWVGKSDDLIKQPGMLVELARRRPEFEYVMIMNLAVDAVHRRILEAVRGMSNLSLWTYVPFEQVERYFADARLLVNTSRFEGCPDTFLQALKYGIPVVSLQADPDGMLAEHGCGRACRGDFERLVGEVSLLMKDEEQYRGAGDCGRAYLAAHHNKDVLVPRYREALLHLWTKSE